MERNILSDMMNRSIRYWWISVLTGILAIALGVLFITTPESALISLAMLFAVGFLVNGIFEMMLAIANRKSMVGWGWNLVGAIIDILLGVLLLALPGLTIFILIYFVGFWILFRSIWAIGSSIDLQTQGVRGWGWILAFAILGVLFSFVFVISPVFGGSFIVAFAAISFMLYGVFRIALGLKLRSARKYIKDLHE